MLNDLLDALKLASSLEDRLCTMEGSTLALCSPAGILNWLEILDVSDSDYSPTNGTTKFWKQYSGWNAKQNVAYSSCEKALSFGKVTSKHFGNYIQTFYCTACLKSPNISIFYFSVAFHQSWLQKLWYMTQLHQKRERCYIKTKIQNLFIIWPEYVLSF